MKKPNVLHTIRPEYRGKKIEKFSLCVVDKKGDLVKTLVVVPAVAGVYKQTGGYGLYINEYPDGIKIYFQPTPSSVSVQIYGDKG
jgi:hypothetical protein